MVSGRITDSLLVPAEFVSVAIVSEGIQAYSDANGFYSLTVPAGKKLLVQTSHLSFLPQSIEIKLKENERFVWDIKVSTKSNIISDVVYEDRGNRGSGIKSLEVKNAGVIPTPGGGIESLIKTLPGVSSNNELSSQYNVRGGNFDENLVYINDVEMYRPFLVRSGQQEGLSVINPDLVQSIKFSAGGFEARYGDRMSSVLDIQYKRPQKFAAGVQATLLGSSVFIEGTNNNHRLRFLAGYRYRTNRYILSNTDTRGEYAPVFQDFQSLISYDLSDSWELSIMGNYTGNRYNFVPQTRESVFGTVSSALKLTVFYEGQEFNAFNTGSGAATLTFRPNPKTRIKFIGSAFRSQEFEYFDVLGQYRLDQLESNLGSEDIGEVKVNLGVGGHLNHARNLLKSTIANSEVKGQHLGRLNEWFWGLKYQHENISDDIHEWLYIDSAGYSTPQTMGNVLNIKRLVTGSTLLTSNRLMAYVQHNFLFSDTSASNLTIGARVNYWDLNNQILFSPRANYSYKPPNWKRDWLFRLATGIYNQPPFFRELRNLEGVINTNVKAQQSIHFIGGADYNFRTWNRPFKFVVEAYYKILNNLVPYEIENVRLRYYANNSSNGYATGIDFRLNGELAKGAESWFSMSIMKIAEDIKNDSVIGSDGSITYPGFIPRPTDQRVNFNIFFQDYIPRYPRFKVHLNLLFGTGMPFGPPDYTRYKDTLRIPPYRRVDIGFSTMLLGENRVKKEGNFFNFFKSAWLSIEVFNLLQVNNVISYLWVADVNGNQWAVPNYLTRRQLNVKLILNF